MTDQELINQIKKDIFQDAMIVMYNKAKIESFELNSKLSTFLYSISRNLWLKHLRDNKLSSNNLVASDLQIKGGDDIHNELEFREDQKLLGDLLQKSGAKCVALLKAFYFEKLKMKKIVELQSYSSEQVAKNQKVRCIKKIRILLMENKEFRDSLGSNNILS